MTTHNKRRIARTIVTVSLTSWVLFVLLELIRPTSVTRLFSPHLFWVTFVVGVGWLYVLSVRQKN
ncbi:hypothetical protein HYV72_01615 [Candidatus Uhrbacteria bacterium]|nr:hypothetical protein [Candidatus Uhrbacteria bacterium]